MTDWNEFNRKIYQDYTSKDSWVRTLVRVEELARFEAHMKRLRCKYRFPQGRNKAYEV